MEFLSKLRRIAAKVETSPGSAETLADADNNCRVWDLAIGSLDVPFDEDPSKYSTGDFGLGESIPGPTSAQVTFRTKFVNNPTETGVAPHWTKFVEAAGCEVVGYSGTLSSSGFAIYPDKAKAESTITIGVYDLERGSSPSGLYYEFAGCIGDCTLSTEGTGKPYNMAWSFTGGLNDISDIAESGIPELTSWQTDIPDSFKGGYFTIGDVSGCISTMEFAFGNTVSPVECVGSDTGYSKFGITNMEASLTINPLVQRNATYDAWGKFVGGTIEEVHIHTSQFHLNIPRAQITTMSVEDADGILRNNLTVRPLRPTASGDYNYASWVMYALNV